MKADAQKQILEWKEELSKQIKTRDHAKKVFDECTTNINALQGGVQFGEALLKKIEQESQPTGTVELGHKLTTKSSKTKGQPT